MTVNNIYARYHAKSKISMVTCYDYTMAVLVNGTPIDAVLVGDSAAMVMHGHDTTLPITIEQMTWHTAAVVKGLSNKLVIADLPFLSYRQGIQVGMQAVARLMQAGAHAVKLEGASGNLEFIKHCVESGVPVMGHIGLTPQLVHQLGGFKVQGKTMEAAEQLQRDAQDLQQAGCFSLVLECVPAELALIVTESLRIPTIGIGAGPDTSGQILVLQDLLGMNSAFSPKFVKQYVDGASLIQDALVDYDNEVKSRSFPILGQHTFKQSIALSESEQ